MDCPAVEELHEWEARKLPAGRRDALTRHVSDCDHCSGVVSRLQSDQDVIADMRDVLGHSFVPQCERFELAEELGRGGMGVVYRAWQRHPRREVAVKVLRPGVLGRGGERRFEREIELLGRLSHPAIASIYEAGMARTDLDEMPFFAMELVRGRRLDVALAEDRPDLRARLELFGAVVEAVAAAHACGVVHRDLKPSNEIVDDSGAPKLIDFGLAVATAEGLEESFRTNAGEIVGTFPFMAPEQLEGNPQTIDERTDVYGLGALLYVILTGEVPLDLTTLSLPAIVSRIAKDDPVAPSQRAPDVPRALDGIALRALAKEPRRRYPSAAELAADVRRFLAFEPVHARPPGPLDRAGLFVRRHRLEVGAGVALAVVIGVSLWWGQSGAERRQQLTQQLGDADAERSRLATTVAELNAIMNRVEGGFSRDLGIARTVAQRNIEAVLGSQDLANRIEEVRQLASQLIVRGLFDVAEGFLDGVLARLPAALGPEAPERIHLEVLRADAMRQAGYAPRAAEHLAAVAEHAEHALGTEDPATVRARLAALVGNQQADPVASEEGIRALRMRWSLAADSTEEAVRLHEDVTLELAHFLVQSDRNAEAMPLLREVFDKRSGRLTVADPALLDAHHRLARGLAGVAAYRDQARHHAALALMGFSSMYGDSNPHSIRVLQTLAAISARDGDMEGAATQMRQAVHAARDLVDGGWQMTPLLMDLANAEKAAGHEVGAYEAYVDAFHHVAADTDQLVTSMSVSFGDVASTGVGTQPSFSGPNEDPLARAAGQISLLAQTMGRMDDALGWSRVVITRVDGNERRLNRVHAAYDAYYLGLYGLAESEARLMLAELEPVTGTERTGKDLVAERGAYHVLMWTALATGRDHEARAWLDLIPDSFSYWSGERSMARAALLDRERCHDEADELSEQAALALARSAYAQHAGTLRHVQRHAERLLVRGRLAEAETFLDYVELVRAERVPPEDPEQVATDVLRARLAARRGQSADARELMRTVLQRTTPDDERLPERRAFLAAWQ